MQSLISLPGQCAERNKREGTNGESTRRVADPETDVGEVDSQEAERWKLDESSRREERGWRRLF